MKVPPPVMAYYKPRLSSALRLVAGDRLYCPDFLYNYSWTQLWRFGRKINRNRTVAGVLMWLKHTLLRRQSEILKFYALERKLIFCLDTCVNNDGGRLDNAGAFMDAELQHSQLDKASDVQCRFKLLYAYYQKALESLNARQQQIIKLSKLHLMFQAYRRELAAGTGAPDDNLEGEKDVPVSLVEMQRIMGFGSIDAVKGFKRRALQALVRTLIRLFRKDLNQAGGDETRREILEEWLERYCESRRGGRRNKNSVPEVVALCLLAVFFACG